MEWKHKKESKWLIVENRKVHCYLCGRKMLKASQRIYDAESGHYSHAICEKEKQLTGTNERRSAVKKIVAGAGVLGLTAVGVDKFTNFGRMSNSVFSSNAKDQIVSPDLETVITSQGIILPSLKSDPANPVAGQMWYRSDAGVTAHYDSIQNRVVYSSEINNGNVNVTSKGIINGLSVLPNDGTGGFGPDTTLDATSVGEIGSPYTQTVGIYEALVYAGTIQDNTTENGISAMIPVFIEPGIYFLQDEIDVSGLPSVALVSTVVRGCILVGAPGKNIIYNSTSNEMTFVNIYFFSGYAVDSSNPSLSAIVFNTSLNTNQTTIRLIGCNFQFPFSNGTFNIDTVSIINFIDTTVDTAGGDMGYVTGLTGTSQLMFTNGEIAGNYLVLNTFSSVNISNTFFQNASLPDTNYNQNGGISVSKCNLVKVDGFWVGNGSAPGQGFIKVINGTTDTVVVKNGYQNNGDDISGQVLVEALTPTGGTAGILTNLIVDNIVVNGGSIQVYEAPDSALLEYLKYNNISGASIIVTGSVNPPTTPSVPTSGTAQENTNSYAVDAYIYGGDVTEIQITRNGTTYTVFSNSSGVAMSGQSYKLNPSDSITVTYTTAPDWTWLSD